MAPLEPTPQSTASFEAIGEIDRGVFQALRQQKWSNRRRWSLAVKCGADASAVLHNVI
jgi:hypothetical protein